MGDPNLFGIERREKVRRKAPSADPVQVQDLIRQYASGYQAQFGEPPVVYKSDGPLLRSLVAQFGAARVRERLAAFLVWDDPYVRSTGYALHVFHRQWNRLAAHVIPAAPARSHVPDADATAEYRKRLRG